MSLGQMRCEFTAKIGELIAWAQTQGMHVAVAEAERTTEQAIINAAGQYGRMHIGDVLRHAGWDTLANAISSNGHGNGIRNSLHESGLAVDLLVYDKDFNYLTGVEAYQALGEWWEKSDTRAAWGGRFGDADHFSFAYQGRK